jgi:hypothetical protein
MPGCTRSRSPRASQSRIALPPREDSPCLELGTLQYPPHHPMFRYSPHSSISWSTKNARTLELLINTSNVFMKKSIAGDVRDCVQCGDQERVRDLTERCGHLVGTAD